MSTVSSSTPLLLNTGSLGPANPRMFMAATTMVSSQVADTARWVGYGVAPNVGTVGMRVGDVLLHVSSSGAANPGRVSLHSVLASSAQAASTASSSGWASLFDITVSLST
jgi:hypothetical protein